MLGHPITLRLTPERKAVLEVAAARRGKPLSTYLRDLIDDAHELHCTLTALQREVTLLHDRLDDPGERSAAGPAAPAPTAIQVETLLLLRALAGPDRMKAVQGELKRLGHEIWTPGEAQR